MKKAIKIILYGFLTWLIPFLISFFFYNKDAQLVIDIFLFKSIMIVLATAVGLLFLILYFRKITGNYLHEGIMVGLVWFAINILLDIVILIPMSKMNISEYFAQIGLRYLIIPMMSIAMGYIAGK